MNGIELEFMIKDKIWNLTKEAEEMRIYRDSPGKGILIKKFLRLWVKLPSLILECLLLKKPETSNQARQIC